MCALRAYFTERVTSGTATDLLPFPMLMTGGLVVEMALASRGRNGEDDFVRTKDCFVVDDDDVWIYSRCQNDDNSHHRM